GLCLRFVCQPEAGQRHAGKADAEFLQSRAARDRLSQALGEFIELGVHNSPFRLAVCPLPTMANVAAAESEAASVTVAALAALVASPKKASVIPARPTPNFFNAARRVIDWAIPLVSSSNLLLMFLLSFVCCCVWKRRIV